MATPHTVSPGPVDFTTAEQAALVAFAVVLVALWLVPTIVAAIRRVPNVASIAVTNVLLGWFPLWWVSSLARACQRVDRTTTHAVAPSALRAGWWPDPIDPQRWRYHDGRRWTDIVHEPTR